MAVPQDRVRELLLQVDASVAIAQRNLAALTREVQQDSVKMDRSLGRVDAAGERLNAMFGRLNSMVATFGVGLSAFGAVQGVRTFLDYADAAKTMEAQLRLATAASGTFSQAQEDVRRIAAETRTGIEETANLYATFQRNAVELGISQEQAARATQTVSEAFQISGATAAEAAGGLRQFLQAVQSGQLRGEELNSVLEQAPRLARLVADSLGITIGQLRAVAAEGQITGDKLVRALTERRFTDQLDAEFRALPVTFDQAMTQIRNAATIAFGAFDRGGELSTALANFALQGAESFASIERDAFEAGAEIRRVFDRLGDLFDPIGASAEANFGFVRNFIHGIDGDLRALQRLFDDVTYNYWRFGGGQTVSIRNAINSDPNYVPPPAFRDNARRGGRADTSFRARTQNAGVNQAFADNLNYYGGGSRPRPPVVNGGGGGGRARGSGGGRSRRTAPQRTPAELREDAYNAAYSETMAVPSFMRDGTLNQSIEAFNEDIRVAYGLSDDLTASLAQLAEIHLDPLTREDQERIERFQRGFAEDLSSGLANAIVQGEDLGDALVSSIQRASAELLSSALLQLLTGGLFGGKSGIGGVASFLGSLFGGFLADGGEMTPGRFYVTGERGPEIVVPKVPSVVIPNHMLGGGGGGRSEVHVYVHPTSEFDVRIQRVSGAVVATAAPRIAAAGAGMAVKELTTPRL